jgi:hypothetical protein
LLMGMLNHPMLFLAEKVLPQSRRAGYPYDPGTDRGTVFIPDSLTLQMSDMIGLSGDTVALKRMDPSCIEAETHLSAQRLCVLVQNNLPGWKACVDGQESSLFTVSQTLIGLIVPAGNHKIRFEFRNPLYVKATLFSFSLFIIILTWSLPWK